MTRWFKKIWKDPVWSTVISTFIIGFIGWLTNAFTQGKVLSCLTTIVDCIMCFLNYKISIYWIVIALLLLLVGAYLFLRYINSTKNDNTDPPYYEYTEDTFNGIPYRWEYNFNQIYNLRPLCPKCKTPIVDYNCPRCRYDIYGKITQSEEEIKTLIADNIRRRYRVYRDDYNI